jgi:hypothetical protein
VDTTDSTVGSALPVAWQTPIMTGSSDNPSSGTVLRINSQEVVWREVGNELVVLQISTATYLSIIGSGQVLWGRLIEGATYDELVDILMQRYGIDRARAARDVDGFLESLASYALLDSSL